MALAGAFGPNQHCDTIRPVGPPVDQRKRSRIRRTFEKILAAEPFDVVERERQLARTGWHGLYGRSPV
jgi:hypothetical protein